MERRTLKRLEAMAYLGVGSSTFYRWQRRGLIPGPLPGTERYDRAAIDAALNKASGLNARGQDDYEARKARFSQSRPRAA